MISVLASIDFPITVRVGIHLIQVDTKTPNNSPRWGVVGERRGLCSPPQYPDWEISHWLYERLASLGIRRTQLRVPLKPLNIIECCDVREFQGALHRSLMTPRDARVSDSCRSNLGCFSRPPQREIIRRFRTNVFISQIIYFAAISSASFDFCYVTR